MQHLYHHTSHAVGVFNTPLGLLRIHERRVPSYALRNRCTIQNALSERRRQQKRMFCIGCVDSEEAMLDAFNDMLMPGNQVISDTPRARAYTALLCMP